MKGYCVRHCSRCCHKPASVASHRSYKVLLMTCTFLHLCSTTVCLIALRGVDHSNTSPPRQDGPRSGSNRGPAMTLAEIPQGRLLSQQVWVLFR